MPDAPLISVVIPVYNGAGFLADALDSVFIQDHRRLDVIVVDDGSTDESPVIAAAWAPAIRLIRQANAGAAAARNRGIEAARGDYLAFLDADDCWPAGRLQKLLAALEAPGRPDMAFGHFRQFFCPRIEPEQRRRLSCPEGSAPGYSAGAMLLRLADFCRVGPFEEHLKLGEFISWFARARDLGLSRALIDDVVLERRIHGANQTIRHREQYRDYARILKHSLDRRRAARND